MPAYIKATKTRRVILATDESTMASAQSRRRWLKYFASWKEKKRTKKKIIRCAKKKKKKKDKGGKRCTFLQPCTGSKMRTMKFDTIHRALQSLVCRQNARLKSGGGKLAKLFVT